MDRFEAKALNIAKEITIARVSCASGVCDGDAGKKIGDMFNAIYESILAVCKED